MSIGLLPCVISVNQVAVCRDNPDKAIWYFQLFAIRRGWMLRVWLEPIFRAFSFILSNNARNSGSIIECRHLISMFSPLFLSKKSKRKTQKPIAGQLFPEFRFFDVLRA